MRDLDWKDFEDSVQYVAAKNNGVNLILTRDAKGFEQGNIPVISPHGFIKKNTRMPSGFPQDRRRLSKISSVSGLLKKQYGNKDKKILDKIKRNNPYFEDFITEAYIHSNAIEGNTLSYAENLFNHI